MRREYNKTIVKAGIEKAKAVTREEALHRAEIRRRGKKEGEVRQHRLIMEYDQRTGPMLREVLEENYKQMVDRDQRLKVSFPKIPRPTFKRGKNIKELLCRAKLPPKRNLKTRTEGEQYKNGVTRCNRGKGKGGCAVCSIIMSRPEEVVREVRVYNTGEDIPVQGRINCKTEGFLYLLWSSKNPSKQYLGRCGRWVSVRLGKHRRDIVNKTRGRVIVEHFAKIRSSVNDLWFVPFMKIRSKDLHVLIELERNYINQYNLVVVGINAIP